MLIWIVAGEYPTPRHPNAGTFVRDQVEALRTAGHTVQVVHAPTPTLRRVVGRVRSTRSNRSTRASRRRVSSPERIPATIGGTSTSLRSRARAMHDAVGQFIAELFMLRSMKHQLEETRPDILHAHNVFPAGMAARRFGRRHSIPYVLTEHTSSFMLSQLTPKEQDAARTVFRDASAVIAVSRQAAEALPVDGHDISIIPNTVTETIGLREPHAGKDGAIVSIGTLVPLKGMADVIEAYAALPTQLRATHSLKIIGAGHEKNRLATYAAKLGVDLELTGHLLPDDVGDILRRSALLVSASRVETFGVTLIEALTAGVPVVATRSGGPQEILLDPGDGALVELGEDLPSRLTHAMVMSLTDGDLQSPKMSEKRSQRAVDRFSAPAVAAKLLDVYAAATA